MKPLMFYIYFQAFLNFLFKNYKQITGKLLHHDQIKYVLVSGLLMQQVTKLTRSHRGIIS